MDCGPFPAPRPDTASHIGLKAGVFVAASSARRGVGWNLLRGASQRWYDVPEVDCMHPTRTVVEALQPGIGLILRVLSHGAVLSIRRLRGLHAWTGRCLPLDSGSRVSGRDHRERMKVGL